MRFIPAEQVHRLLDYPSLVATLAEAHRGEKPMVDRSELHHEPIGEGRQTFLNLPAWIPGRAMGVKMITVMPANEAEWNLPTVHAVYQLFDGENGEPLAAIDGTALTLRKTAADSALGADLLAAPHPRRLLMVGAGALAPHLVQAHLTVRPSLASVEARESSSAPCCSRPFSPPRRPAPRRSKLASSTRPFREKNPRQLTIGVCSLVSGPRSKPSSPRTSRSSRGSLHYFTASASTNRSTPSAW